MRKEGKGCGGEAVIRAGSEAPRAKEWILVKGKGRGK